MADDSRVIPPYLPYKTFINSLEYLDPVIPPRIDRTIWKQPSTVQSQILSAYKFFGLINESQQPTPKLRQLVEHRLTPGSNVKALLNEQYREVLKHDLGAITLPILNDAFKSVFGIEGETRRKAVRFFLQAAKAADFTLSKFLLDQTRNTGPRKRRARSTPNGDAEGGDVQSFDDEPTVGTTKTVTLRSGGELTLRLSVDLFELSTEDRDFVFGLVDSLQSYEKKSAQHASPGGAK